VSTRFLSHLAGGRSRAADERARADGEQHADERTAGLERQQALLIGALRRAEGAAVSYDELRDFGIEFPAAVVSELVLAGIAIERCYGAAPGGRRAVGVRLLPDPEPEPAAESPPEPAPAPAVSAPAEPAPPPTGDWDTVRVYRPSLGRSIALAAVSSVAALPDRIRRPPRQRPAADRGPRPSLRLAAPLLLLTIIGLVAAVLLIAVSPGHGHPRTPLVRAHRTQARAVASAPARSPAPTAPAAPRATSTPPTPVSPALATELESRGHALLENGQSADAVPVLKRAVQATGENLAACAEPASSNCFTYAYALYDLGRALRLSGDPTAAVPILEHRLQIDNQRPVVEAELQLARRDLS
jgi:hypothetical protein